MTFSFYFHLNSRYSAIFILLTFFCTAFCELVTKSIKTHYGENWSEYVNPEDERDVHLFKAFPGRVNFPNALENCENYGSKLASFRSPHEYAFIKELVKATLPDNSYIIPDYWLGIYHRGGPPPVDIIRDAKFYFLDQTRFVMWKSPDLYHIRMKNFYAPPMNLSVITENNDKENMTVYCMDYKAEPTQYSKDYPIEKQEFLVNVYTLDCATRLFAHVCKVEGAKADPDARPLRAWAVSRLDSKATTVESHSFMVESVLDDTTQEAKTAQALEISSTEVSITSTILTKIMSTDHKVDMAINVSDDATNTTAVMLNPAPPTIRIGADLRHNVKTNVEKTKRNITSELFNNHLSFYSILAVILCFGVVVLICVGLFCCGLFNRRKRVSYNTNPKDEKNNVECGGRASKHITIDQQSILI